MDWRSKGMSRRVAAQSIGVAVLVCLGGCGGKTTAPDRPARVRGAHPQDNVGVGALTGTRFVVAPVVTVLVDPRHPTDAGYSVYARLNRDLPRHHKGIIAASFYVDDVRDEDPIGRLSRKRPNCFGNGVGISRYNYTAPRREGASVRVTIRSFDRHGSESGSLSMTVRLKQARVLDPHYYGPDPYNAAVGC